MHDIRHTKLEKRACPYRTSRPLVTSSLTCISTTTIVAVVSTARRLSASHSATSSYLDSHVCVSQISWGGKMQ